MENIGGITVLPFQTMQGGNGPNNDRGQAGFMDDGLDEQGLPSDAALMAYLQRSQSRVGNPLIGAASGVNEKPEYQTSSFPSSSLGLPAGTAGILPSNNTAINDSMKLFKQLMNQNLEQQQQQHSHHRLQSNELQHQKQQLDALMAEFEPKPLAEKPTSSTTVDLSGSSQHPHLKGVDSLFEQDEFDTSSNMNDLGGMSMIPMDDASALLQSAFNSNDFSMNASMPEPIGRMDLFFGNQDSQPLTPQSSMDTTANSLPAAALPVSSFDALFGSNPLHASALSGNNMMLSSTSMGQSPLGVTHREGYGEAWSAASAELLGDLESAVKEKKEKPKKSKLDDKPKRPLSAYNLFFKEERIKILEELPESAAAAQPSHARPRKGKPKPHGKIDFQSLAKMVGGRWKNLEPDRKQLFQKKAADDLSRYRAEMEDYVRKQAG